MYMEYRVNKKCKSYTGVCVSKESCYNKHCCTYSCDHYRKGKNDNTWNNSNIQYSGSIYNDD